MPKLNNTSFEKIIADHKAAPNLDTMIAAFEAFELIAKNIYKHFVKGKVAEEVFRRKSKIIRELVCVAFIKMERYDPKKGNAFNFFTTIMLGWLRQVYRASKNYAELKVKYAEKCRNS